MQNRAITIDFNTLHKKIGIALSSLLKPAEISPFASFNHSLPALPISSFQTITLPHFKTLTKLNVNRPLSHSNSQILKNTMPTLSANTVLQQSSQQISHPQNTHSSLTKTN